MEFRTTVKIEAEKRTLRETSVSLFLGSCFAENVGKKFLDNKFNCMVNPFGVLYNPVSIFGVLDQLLETQVDLSQYLFQYNNVWGSWLHSTLFSASSREACFDKVMQVYTKAKEQLSQLDVLFMTFGTNRYYQLKAEGWVVSNCHKCPASWFDEKEAPLEMMIQQGVSTLEKLFALRPEAKVVLTVSPYRYSKYGFHESKLAKATLLLLADALQKRFPEQVVYFPAYEIMDDELRDYRFYASDMLHPSEVAIEYIWQRFRETFIHPQTELFIQEWTAIHKKLMHRSISEHAEETKVFYQTLLSDLQHFKEKYPHIDIVTELEQVQSILN